MYPDHTPFPGLPDLPPYFCDLPRPKKKKNRKKQTESPSFCCPYPYWLMANIPVTIPLKKKTEFFYTYTPARRHQFWSVLPQKTMLRSVACADTGDHVDVPGLCCCQIPDFFLFFFSFLIFNLSQLHLPFTPFPPLLSDLSTFSLPLYPSILCFPLEKSRHPKAIN